MTKGVVLFALNNAEINYIKLAEDTAKRVSSFLKVPVSLITDSSSASSISDTSLFDKVIIVPPSPTYSTRTFKDGHNKTKGIWKNNHRDSIFNLTPYSETLVIDVDYVINSSILNYCWDQPHDFLIYEASHDLASWRSSKDYTFISQYSVQFYWATVFFFKKTPTNEKFFALITHVKENWNYYNFLYQLSSPNFRNDFAFSIAIHIMNGQTKGSFAKALPGKLFYTLDTDMLIDLKNRKFIFLMDHKKDSFIPASVSNLDVHVMNKFSLLRYLEND